MSVTITAAAADRHEALHLKLSALAAHVQAMAVRRGDTPLPPETRRLAGDLLSAVHPFAVHPFADQPAGSQQASRPQAPGRRIRLPVVASGYAGLAAQLGEALAGLDAWEARHSFWSPTHKCFLWRVEGRPTPLPIRRLRPEALAIVEPAAEAAEVSDMRHKLLERIDELYEEAYLLGLEGRLPPAHRGHDGFREKIAARLEAGAETTAADEG